MNINEELEVMPKQKGLEIHGVFEEYRFTLDGYSVPRLSGCIKDGILHLKLDNRFGCEIPEAHAESVVWFVANAMAIAEGYSCFGENSEPLNPYKRQLNKISVELQSISDASQ